MEKGPDGLFRMTDPKLKVEPDAFVKVASGALEASNVNTVESMVEMINLSRQFEMQVKMMQTAKQNDEAAAQIMRLN
jgi:flagellar basal-body rod protein FlgF